MGEFAVPALTADKLLPPGIHELTLQQVEELFGRFQGSDRRPRLMRKLRDYLDELRRTGWPVQVLLDGSFVMAAVDRPEDIDVIIVLPKDWNFQTDLRPFEYNVLSRRRIRRFFGLDVFVVGEASERERNLIEYFQGVNVKWREAFGLSFGLRKGIVRVAS